MIGRFTMLRCFACFGLATLLALGCNSPKPKTTKGAAQGSNESDDQGIVDRRERQSDERFSYGDGEAALPKEKGPKHDPSRSFTEADVESWVAAHRAKVGADARYYGYVHIPLNMYADKEQASLARIGIFKTVNHVSKAETAYVGEDISDGYGVAYAIDTRKIWGERGPEKWDLIARPLNQVGDGDGGLLGSLIGLARNRDNSVRVKGDIISVGNMQLENVDPAKSIPAPRFVYNATFPNVYNFLIDTPGGAAALVRRERVVPQVRAFAAHKNAIVNGPRVTAFYQTQDGRYYISTGDYFANFEGREIPFVEGNPVPSIRGNTLVPQMPGGTNIVSESYVQAPNGCPQYFIWGAGTQERGRAELVFVADPQNHSQAGSRRYLVTGRSCITCHINGAQSAPSDMPRYIEEGRVAQAEEARRVWTSNDELQKIYAKITDDFRQKCMKPVIDELSNAGPEFGEKVLNGLSKEPVLFLIRQIEPELQGRR